MLLILNENCCIKQHLNIATTNIEIGDLMIEYEDIMKDSPYLICYLISLTKTHDFYINKHIKNETEILPSQYYMLMFLYHEMGTNQSDIAKACLMDRSGVSRAFKDFEEKGLITREINENNRQKIL